MSNYNEKPKRTPSSLVKSLEFDGSKKILVVEGKNDRLFFEFVVENINKDAILLEIDNIEIESEYGGNKGKILNLIGLIPEQIENIKFFIDRDYDIDESTLKSNTIITDYKDLESYLINFESFTKFIKIGLKTEKINAKKLMEHICDCEFFGFIRKYSTENNLNLSINDCNDSLNKYIKYNSNKIEIEKSKYLTVLKQKSKFTESINDMESKINDFAKVNKQDTRFITHGKDLIQIVTIICTKLGFRKDSIESTFWMSFDHSNYKKYKNLTKAIEFIQ